MVESREGYRKETRWVRDDGHHHARPAPKLGYWARYGRRFERNMGILRMMFWLVLAALFFVFVFPVIFYVLVGLVGLLV